jgi:hypothetical protein
VSHDFLTILGDVLHHFESKICTSYAEFDKRFPLSEIVSERKHLRIFTTTHSEVIVTLVSIRLNITL